MTITSLDTVETSIRLTTFEGVPRIWPSRRASRGAAQRVRGRMKVNLAPRAEDSAQIFPPWASTIPLAM